MGAKSKPKGLSRRAILKGSAATAALAAGSGAVTGFPTVWAQNIKNVTLRQFGTGVSNLNEVAKKVKEIRDFSIEKNDWLADKSDDYVIDHVKNIRVLNIFQNQKMPTYLTRFILHKYTPS